MKESNGKRYWNSLEERRFRQIGCAEIILACLLYGGNVIAGRIVAPQVPPFALSAVRAILGLAVLGPFLMRLGPELRPKGEDWGRLALQGFLAITLAYSTFAWGMRFSPAINASIIFATFPAVNLLLLVLFWRVKPAGIQLIGIIMAFAGLTIVAAHGSVERLLSVSFAPTDGILLLNVFAVALSNILSQKLMERYAPLVVSAYSLFFGFLGLLPWALWEIRVQGWHLSWQGWVFLFYMGCCVSGLAVVLNFAAIYRIGSGVVAIFNNLNPIFAIALAALFLGEPLHLYHVIGIILVLSGVGLSLRSDQRLNNPIRPSGTCCNQAKITYR
ncbi:MAG: DMT family transporter [Moorellaceae bacterium]